MALLQILAELEALFEPVRRFLTTILSDPRVIVAWAVLVAAATLVVIWDLRTNNRALSSLMQVVWILVTLYSGPFGLALYWYAGRTQISRDSLWRRGVRSTAHCYSGCGAGEVVGVTLAQGILALAVGWVAAITFGFAYLFGYALTVGPLLQDGVTFPTAVRDAFYSETPSITIMEITAIGADLLLAQNTHMGQPLFWMALALSLSLGFIAAYPINLALVHVGVKEGMANPAALGDPGQAPD